MTSQPQTYSFLKMYFQQEKLPKEIYIKKKNILIKNVKETAIQYIKAIDYLIEIGTDLKRSRYAESNKYWLQLIYDEIRAPKSNNQ